MFQSEKFGPTKTRSIIVLASSFDGILYIRYLPMKNAIEIHQHYDIIHLLIFYIKYI